MKRFSVISDGKMLKSEKGDIITVFLADKIALANGFMSAEGFVKHFKDLRVILNGMGKICPDETEAVNDDKLLVIKQVAQFKQIAQST